MKEVNVLPKKATSKILSIETLYINTDAGQTVKRFARTLIDENENKTRQIINSENKWESIAENDFYEAVENTRALLITDLTKSTKPEEPEKEEQKEKKN